MRSIVGIDFSLNSTAVCIFDGEYSFFNFVNTDDFYGKKGSVLKQWTIHEQIKDFVTFVKFNKQDFSDFEYSDAQLNKLQHYNYLTYLILEKIPVNSVIGIEGFSYASIGKSELELVAAQTLLRYKILLTKDKNLTVVSPSGIKKKFTGKGNANKLAMFESFKKLSLDIPLWNFINNSNVIEKDKVLKPIDDLIDSFAIVQCLK